MLGLSPRPLRFKQLALALPLILALAGIDWSLRQAALRKLPGDFQAYYGASLLFMLYAWYTFLGLASRLVAGRPRLGFLLIFGVALIYAGTLLGTVGFFAHFSVLPNVFTFDYLLDEPSDCWIYIKDALQPAYFVGLLVVAGGLAAYLWQAARQSRLATGRLDLTVSSVVLVALCLIMHNNVRMGPNAFTPDVDAVFSLSKAIENNLRGSEQMQVVSSGARMDVKAELGPLPHHVLLILNESVRAKSQGIYGYYRPTTPHLQSFFAAHAGEMVRFDHAYANATRTMLAFPSFFTGIVPSQTGALLHRVPLVYDFARAFDLNSTFLLSTQSLHWGNFDKFLDVPSLDYSWYKEIGDPTGKANDRFESLDDKELPEMFSRFLAQRDAKKKFFGVIQLTNTHAPYAFDKASDQWHDGRLTNAYDNSLHYNDRQIGAVLAQLEEAGLLSDTLIVSTSDHGEAFGEHGYYGHLNTFYDEEARVPLWLHLPERMAKQEGILRQLRLNARESVSNADIIPTVLSLLTRPHMDAVTPYLTNLTGAPLDRPLPADRAIFLQNYNDIDEKTMFVGLGVVMGPYKYLLKFNQALGEEELYDLRTDPKEEHNIWAAAPLALREKIYRQIRKHKNSSELFIKAFPERAKHT